MTPADVPTVFIVDDDDLVRAAIRGMLKSVGLHRETFGRRKNSCASRGHRMSSQQSEIGTA